MFPVWYTRRVKVYFVVVLVIMFYIFLILKYNKTILFSSKCKLNYSLTGVADSVCRDAFPLLLQWFVVKWLCTVPFKRSKDFVPTALPIIKYRSISHLYSTRHRRSWKRELWTMLVLRTMNCTPWSYSMLRYNKTFIPAMKFVKTAFIAF